MGLPKPGPALGPAVRRVGWGVADQAFSSLTNFAINILIARALGPERFGAFAFAFTTYLVVMGASRALGTEPLVVRYSNVDPDRWRRGAARAVGTAAAVGGVAAVGCVAIGALAGGAVGDAYLAVGLALPGLMVQDAWRFAFFAAGRGRDAFLNDVLWAVLLLPAFAALIATDAVSVLTATLVWGGAATLAGLAGAAQAGFAPRPREARAWWREHRDIAPSYLGEFLSLSGAKQLSIFGIGAFGGLAAAGGFRAGQTLLGPLKVVFQGLQIVAVPEAVRIYKRHGDRYVQACFLLGAAMAAIAMAFGGVMLLLPTAAGEALLGETWAVARSVVLPLAVSTAAAGIVTGAATGLRVLVAARHSFRARLVSSLLTSGMTIAGAAVGGIQTAAWGGAVAVCLSAVLWWRSFLAALRAVQVDESLAAGAAREPEPMQEVPLEPEARHLP